MLLHRAEIDKLVHKTQETGHTIVPLALYFKDGRAKVEIALAKGKKEYDKRQTLREKQDRREADRAMSRPRQAPAARPDAAARWPRRRADRARADRDRECAGTRGRCSRTMGAAATRRVVHLEKSTWG